MQKKKLTHDGYEIGDLSERVLLQDRTIVPPVFGSVDFDEAFENTAIWAAIRPIRGRYVLDQTGRETLITDEVIIRYRSEVTTEYFIQKTDGSRLKIERVMNVSERGEYTKLECSFRGPTRAGMR